MENLNIQSTHITEIVYSFFAAVTQVSMMQSFKINGRKIEVYSQRKGYIDTQIFDAEWENIFVIELQKRREAYMCA
jgi:hypothetical protein